MTSMPAPTVAGRRFSVSGARTALLAPKRFGVETMARTGHRPDPTHP
ncbi:hypothetical protein [Streptomyces sp. NPDC088350]